MRSSKLKKAFLFASAVASALATVQARAGTAVNTSGAVQQGTDTNPEDPNFGQNNPAITISFSGQTALRSFDTSQGITELTPGTSIILHDGTDGAPVEYTAPNDSTAFVQLASSDFTSPDVDPGTPTDPSTDDIQQASAIQLQWHEQGSVDGFYDLVNDETGYNQTTGPISNEALRTPSSSNPTWINTNKFTSAGSINGFSLDNSAADVLDQTYNTNVYTQATGVNLLGGQNRIQFAVGEYTTEGVSQPGTASPLLLATQTVLNGVTNTSYAIGAGYGLGNTNYASAATYTGLGVGNVRQQFQPTTILNESQSIENPTTDTNYANGPWNTAGVNNITSTPIAATAVTYSANPGTGLQRIDLGDAQWLQLTGRLQNGALFNVVARTVDTGQRIVFADNTGVDPSWAVGSNDDGNSTSSTAASLEHSIGPSLRFDGKTSGSEAEKTIAQSRMAVGALSVPEASAASSNAPVRALDVDFTDQTDVNPADDHSANSNFVSASFNTIVSNGSGVSPSGPTAGDYDSYQRYQAVLISHYNTVKAPNPTALEQELNNEGLSWEGNTNYAAATAAQINAAWAAIPSFIPSQNTELDISNPATPVAGIQGDPTGDVAAFISNIADSVGTAAANLTANKINNPGDNLYINGFLTPGLLDYTRTADGGPISDTPSGSEETSTQQTVQSNYGKLFGTAGTFAANSETIGSASYYGAGNTSGPAINGNIPITSYNGSTPVLDGGAPSTGGNYLFGNFAQNGVRDYNAVVIDGLQALAALEFTANASGTLAGTSMFSGLVDSTKITTNAFQVAISASVTNTYQLPTSLATMIGSDGTVGATKGDLIVLGDFNGDGSFNGEDLYLLATGASLADSTTSTTLTATAATFSDVIRNPTIVLRKNAALSYLNANATPEIKTEARAVLSGATVPTNATDLHTTDPITGLEQFTYDPAGSNAFNSADVNRDGVLDLNDAFAVDSFNGQSYTNLSQSVVATIPTPVTGVVEPVDLSNVQQIDGEAAISQADVNVINSALTGTANSNFYGYVVTKSGPDTVTWARTGGTNTVFAGAGIAVTGGVLNIGGTIDPFSDNNIGGATAGNHASLAISNGATVNVVLGRGTITVSALTISPAVLNINDNTVVIAAGAANVAAQTAAVAGYVASGYNSGTWTGAGINSAKVASINASLGNSHAYGIGYANSNDAAVAIDHFAPNTVVIKPALIGDANLDGVVNYTDFQLLSANFNGVGTTWDQGDFNYAGSTSYTDFQLLSANFNDSTSLDSAQFTAMNDFAAQFDKALIPNADGDGFTIVPEPASLSLLGLASAGLLARRRRRRAV